MFEKDSSNWLPVLTASWGAMVAYIRQLRNGKKFHPISFLLHLIVAGFSGTMLWLLSTEFALTPTRTAFLTGMGGYLGTEVLKMFEDRWLLLFPGSKLGSSGEQQK